MMLRQFFIGLQVEEPYAEITLPSFFGDANKLLGYRVTAIETWGGHQVIKLEANKHLEDRCRIKEVVSEKGFQEGL